MVGWAGFTRTKSGIAVNEALGCRPASYFVLDSLSSPLPPSPPIGCCLWFGICCGTCLASLGNFPYILLNWMPAACSIRCIHPAVGCLGTSLGGLGARRRATARLAFSAFLNIDNHSWKLFREHTFLTRMCKRRTFGKVALTLIQIWPQEIACSRWLLDAITRKFYIAWLLLLQVYIIYIASNLCELNIRK